MERLTAGMEAPPRFRWSRARVLFSRGLALANSGGANYLYAADSKGQILVYNSTFQPVHLAGNFTDPNAVPGYAPFNIQLVGSDLYVTYAKLTATGAALPGGYIDVFGTDGDFLQRFSTGGTLYAPWGSLWRRRFRHLRKRPLSG